MIEDKVLEDEYGKRTRFRGSLLVSNTTIADGKPQWAEVDVWRTEAGSYVVQRKTIYRYRHLTDTCPRLGVNLVPRPATDRDDYPCPRCNSRGTLIGGYGVEDRNSIDIARTPVDLIHALANSDGTYSGFARATLADICDQDDQVAKLWMEEIIP